MKLVFQFCRILCFTFAGELLHAVLPFPVPAGIYGLILLLICLLTGILKLDKVDSAGQFLVDIMPVMFIPSAAGLLESRGLLQEFLVPFLIIVLISTWLVMIGSGRVTQFFLNQKERKGGEKHD